MSSFSAFGTFPHTRLRRNRTHSWLRNLVAQHHLSPHDLILPIFIQEGENCSTPIPHMPGVHRLSIDKAVTLASQATQLGIQALALFPVIAPQLKTPHGEEAYNPDNLMCRAIKTLKKAAPDIGLICDIALDPYTSHGHDGILTETNNIDNDQTLAILAKQALTCVEAGCDVLAPSAMMDGTVATLREHLEHHKTPHIAILSYAAKYASCFYGPFRTAVGTALNLGTADKKTYQMDPRNHKEALQEIAMDVQEGADLIMIKPGLPCLDIIQKAAELFPVPLCAYQVSGEYAMIKAAGLQGWLDSTAAFYESCLAMKRAGAHAIFTYAAIEIAGYLAYK